MTSVSSSRPRCFEIVNQGGAGLVGVRRVLLHACRQVAVLVPGFVEELHETDAPLDQPPRQQAVAGIAGFLGILDAVHVERLLRFAAQVHQFGALVCSR